jgi:phage shock protein A
MSCYLQDMNAVHEERTMFDTLKTLIQGANARTEERVRAAYSIELIDQKIREATDGLKLAKGTLASLIQRQRSEERQIDVLTARAADLMGRGGQALAADRAELAQEAAEAVAVMENELSLRRETRARLEARVVRLQASVEATNRRIIDLKQGAVTARAWRDEQALQKRLNTTLAGQSPLSEAQDLINDVMGQQDAMEQADILQQIDRNLSRCDVAERLSDEGFGRPMKTTASDVLARMKKTA